MIITKRKKNKIKVNFTVDIDVDGVNNVSRTNIHNVPVLKDDKVIGVCIEHKNNAYRCEIWDRSVETEISGDTKQITAIILK